MQSAAELSKTLQEDGTLNTYEQVGCGSGIPGFLSVFEFILLKLKLASFINAIWPFLNLGLAEHLAMLYFYS